MVTQVVERIAFEVDGEGDPVLLIHGLGGSSNVWTPIMITLAIGVAFYYLCLQNYSVFNGFQGFHTVRPPVLFGIDWRDPVPFYFLVLFWAVTGYFFIKYLARAPFGVALQGIRDNPRRMSTWSAASSSRGSSWRG